MPTLYFAANLIILASGDAPLMLATMSRHYYICLMLSRSFHASPALRTHIHITFTASRMHLYCHDISIYYFDDTPLGEIFHFARMLSSDNFEEAASSWYFIITNTTTIESCAFSAMRWCRSSSITTLRIGFHFKPCRWYWLYCKLTWKRLRWDIIFHARRHACFLRFCATPPRRRLSACISFILAAAATSVASTCPLYSQNISHGAGDIGILIFAVWWDNLWHMHVATASFSPWHIYNAELPSA